MSPAQAAPQNAKPTPTCMSTAASAPKPAAVASRPARTCWAVSADASGARGTADGRSFGVAAATTMAVAFVGFRRVWAVPGLLAIVVHGLVDRHRFAYAL